MSGICLLLRRWVAYEDSGSTTKVSLDGPAGDRSCSGRRSARSTYSRLVIFCTSFGGKEGVPGKIARGLDVELAVGVGAIVDVKVVGAVVRAVVRDESGGWATNGERRSASEAVEENGGRLSADTSGGGGSNPRVPAECVSNKLEYRSSLELLTCVTLWDAD